MLGARRRSPRFGGHRVEHFVVNSGGVIERPQGGKCLFRRHLFGGPFRPATANPANAIAKRHLGGVLASMAWARGADDLVLRGGEEPLLRDLLQPALVVATGPGLAGDQAPA